jgi:predicted regulator of Ras-like GTPase activity (Roadblock/LC7/MglB family)
MDVAQALTELRQLSSQVEAAVVLDGDGNVLGGDPEYRAEELASVARDLRRTAEELGAQEPTRVEVEVAEGAVFVLTEHGRTIVARTRSEPPAGLVVYDLRTCLHSLAQGEGDDATTEASGEKQKRTRRSKSSETEAAPEAATEESAE